MNETEYYIVTRTCKEDMISIFEDNKEMLELIKTFTPNDMKWIASKLENDYINQLYWESLGAVIETLTKNKQREEWRRMRNHRKKEDVIQ